MKNDVIIILPGFEYKPKGPLHIDKIKISVKVDGLTLLLYTINNSAEELEFLKVSDPSEFYDESDRSMYDGQEVLYSKTVLTNPYKKVKPGYFCSFYTAEGTIYVSTINDPEYVYSLLNAIEHDGLCYLKLNNINTNIIFSVSFYSLVEHENNYVLFDTISYYYNPLINAQASVSILESEPISLYYDPHKNPNDEYTIELPDNVILFQKESDGYHLVKYNKKEYILNESTFKPEENMAWVCPLVFYRKNEVFLGYPYENFLITTAKSLSSPNNFVTPINALLAFDNSKNIPSLLDNIKSQQSYFEKQVNDLGLTFSELYNHGIYLSNWGEDFTKEFGNNAWGIIKLKEGYAPFYYSSSPIRVAIRDVNFEPLGLGRSFYLDKYPDNINADRFDGGDERTFYKIKKDSIKKEDANKYKLFKLLGLWLLIKVGIDDSGNYTWYKFYDSQYNKFNYLYNQIPYVKIENISPKLPFEIDYDTNREWLIKISVKNKPSDFIENEKRVSLQDTKGEYLWFWLSSGIHRYIFPNYWLGINYKESLLTIKNKSDYEIVPLLELKTDNTTYGIYEDLVVISNIDTTELLPSLEEEVNEVPVSSFTSFKIKAVNTYVKPVLVDSKVTIHESGLYVFSYNGIKQGASSDYNKLLNLSINGTVIHSFKLPHSNNYIVLYLPLGEYHIKAEVENSSYMSMVHITDINLYKVNADNTTPYGSMLLLHLDSLKEESEYKVYTENDGDVFPYVILPTVFTYAEVNRKCYKKIFNGIYPPPKAYQKVHALYTEENGKAVEIEEKPSNIFLLGRSKSIPSTISIKHITIKKLI